MRMLSLIATIGGALLCNGCALLNQTMRPVALAEYPIRGQAIDPTTGAVVDAASGFSTTQVPIIPEEYLKQAYSNPIHRDWLQDALLQRSDILCGQYVDTLYNTVTLRKFALNEITSVANAVGTFATSVDVARAMTLVGTITSGTSAQMDSELLQSQMISLIITQIKRNREQILGQIMVNRENKAMQYPLSLAVRDAERYHQQCSFIAAMTGLTEAAQKASPSSQAQSNAAQANTAKAKAEEITTQAAAPEAKSGRR